MDAPLTIKIVSPSGLILEDRADSVRMDALDGSFGVLPGHISTIAALKAGVVTYIRSGERFSVKISGGVAEICRDVILIFAE